MSCKYPNFELLEYKFLNLLKENGTYKSRLAEAEEQARNNIGHKMRLAPFVVAESWLQTWPSTNLAFDVDEAGNTLIGGQAFSSAYTVVMHEFTTDMYGIFIDDIPFLIIWNPSEEFFNDVKNRRIRYLSEAREIY